MQKLIIFGLAALLAAPFFGHAQSAADGLSLAQLDEKMDVLGDEMDQLGDVMDGYGKEMDKLGKKMEHGRATEKEQTDMESLSKKMSDLGEKMGDLGEQMGQMGEKMGEKHQKMTDWFFRELKKDGLLRALNGEARIIFDEKGLNVNGENASVALFEKYKKSVESFWGKPLKPKFTFFFKGDLYEKNGNLETNGTMNSDF